MSTLKKARKQGHSGRLLQLAIQEMTEREFVWSYLGTGVNDHYARYGWRTVSTAYYEGKIPSGAASVGLEPTVVDDSLLKEMARLHSGGTSTTPMANDRTQRLWETAVRYRITRASDEVFAAWDAGELVAYLVTHKSEDAVQLVEAAGLAEPLAELVAQRLDLAASKGVRHVNLSLPLENAASAAFFNRCESVNPAEDRAWMARPIGDRTTWPDLSSILADPRGRRSELDNF